MGIVFLSESILGKVDRFGGNRLELVLDNIVLKVRILNFIVVIV